MEKKGQLPTAETLTGAEALANGIADAGARFVSAYPGAPVTQVVEALLRLARPRNLYVEWSSGEKVAFEEALGCSLAGVRSAVIAKHVGINHVLDPLMTANLTGIRGGMLLLAGDDPGSYGSQNEQDSRLLGAFAEIPVLEPSTPEQGYRMVRQAFRLSERFRLPVMIRFVADYAGDRGTVPFFTPDPQADPDFVLSSPFKALPADTVENHTRLHRKLRQIASAFDVHPFDDFCRSAGSGPTGLIAGGHAALKLARCLPDSPALTLLEMGTLFPFPEKTPAALLSRLKRLFVLEEGEPFLEDRIRVLVQKMGLSLPIFGKTTGDVSWEGDLKQGAVAGMLSRALEYPVETPADLPRTYPSRQPLGDGCPHKPFFTVLKRLVSKNRVPRPLVVGETGCLVRLNNPPLEMLDVKYSLGSSIGIACGLRRGGMDNKIIAALGDSAFFHSAVNGLINAVHHGIDVVIAVMDNRTVALTGFQDPIGGGKTAMGETAPEIRPEALARSLGVGDVRVLDAFDETAITRALMEVLPRKGPSVLVVRGPCPYTKTRKCRVTPD